MSLESLRKTTLRKLAPNFLSLFLAACGPISDSSTPPHDLIAKAEVETCDTREKWATSPETMDPEFEGSDLELDGLNKLISQIIEKGLEQGALKEERVKVYEQWRIEALEKEDPKKLFLVIINQLKIDIASHNRVLLKSSNL